MDSKKKGPKNLHNPSDNKAPKTAVDPSMFREMSICWQFGKIDFEGEWGLNLINDKIKFDCSDSLYEKLEASGVEEFVDAVVGLDGKSFDSLNSFLSKLNQVV